MSLNHDQFIQNQNYLDLDTSLQWYIDTVSPQYRLLRQLAEKHPEKAKLLFQRDPVLRKIHKIHKKMASIISEGE